MIAEAEVLVRLLTRRLRQLSVSLRSDAAPAVLSRFATCFMTYFNSKLAREIGRLTGWRQKIWSRRYQAIVVSQEEEAQEARLAYVLAHGVKEQLVAHAG